MEKGDVVQLKSGGPLMTVIGEAQGDMYGDDKVHCDWFDRKGLSHRDTFYRACLNLIKEDLSNMVQ